MSDYTAKSPEDYLVILQQDAPEPMMRAMVRDITPETLLEYSIRHFESLPIDVYCSDANHSGGTYYRSKVAERILTSPKTFRHHQDKRVVDRLQALADAGTDPLEIYCKGAHEAGIDYMVNLRMNDLHDVVGQFQSISKPNHTPDDSLGEPYYYDCQWKLDHPEYLIGDPTDDTPPNTASYWQRLALNYAFGAVRQYIFGMAEELVTNYDLDILELDFIRFAFIFRRAEAYAQRDVLTGLIRRIRSACDEQGKLRGRPVRLSARVPDTLDLGLRCGIDAARWLSEGLLDMITISGGYSPCGTPWHDIGDVAKRHGVPAKACLSYGKSRKDIRRIRAAAHRAWSEGVSGFKLWNFWYTLDYYSPKGRDHLKIEFVKELVERDTLSKRILIYGTDKISDPDTLVGPAHFHHATMGQVPMMIGVSTDGIGQTVTFNIPDEGADRSPGYTAELVMELVNFWPYDETLELYWNNTPLGGVEYESLTLEGAAETYKVTCPVSCAAICKGPNKLELRLTERDPRLDPFISLMDAALVIPEDDA